MVGVLLLLGCATGVAAALVTAHRRAQAAADLAALAGASALAQQRDACGAAGAIARADGARLASCEVDGTDVVVGVVVAGPHWLGQPADLSARARAGPDPAGGLVNTADTADTADTVSDPSARPAPRSGRGPD